MTPLSSPLASSDAAASRSAADASGLSFGVTSPISTPGCDGGLTVIHRIPSKDTSLITCRPRASR
jgi:hypothetical protein